MKNYINISISAKDAKNYNLLIIINKFNDNSIYLKIKNTSLNKLEYADELKDSHLLNIINAFLAYAKRDEYDLKNSDFSELHLNFINLITYYIISALFSASLIYNEIKLINIKEY